MEFLKELLLQVVASILASIICNWIDKNRKQPIHLALMGFFYYIYILNSCLEESLKNFQTLINKVNKILYTSIGNIPLSCLFFTYSNVKKYKKSIDCLEESLKNFQTLINKVNKILYTSIGNIPLSCLFFTYSNVKKYKKSIDESNEIYYYIHERQFY